MPLPSGLAWRFNCRGNPIERGHSNETARTAVMVSSLVKTRKSLHFNGKSANINENSFATEGDDLVTKNNFFQEGEIIGVA